MTRGPFGCPRGEDHGQGHSCASHRRSPFLPFLKALLGFPLFRCPALGPSSLVCVGAQVPRPLDLQLGPPRQVLSGRSCHTILMLSTLLRSLSPAEESQRLPKRQGCPSGDPLCLLITPNLNPTPDVLSQPRARVLCWEPSSICAPHFTRPSAHRHLRPCQPPPVRRPFCGPSPNLQAGSSSRGLALCRGDRKGRTSKEDRLEPRAAARAPEFLPKALLGPGSLVSAQGGRKITGGSKQGKTHLCIMRAPCPPCPRRK